MAKQIERSALVGFSCRQMFELVNNIEDYPQFMEGCVDAEVLAANQSTIEARLHLKKGKLEKSFTTRNTLFPHERIELHLLEGPFKTLEGVWRFEPLSDEACKVSLSLTFEFESKLVGFAVDPWFEAVGNQLVSAVCERAKDVYAVSSR